MKRAPGKKEQCMHINTKVFFSSCLFPSLKGFSSVLRLGIRVATLLQVVMSFPRLGQHAHTAPFPFTWSRGPQGRNQRKSTKETNDRVVILAFRVLTHCTPFERNCSAKPSRTTRPVSCVGHFRSNAFVQLPARLRVVPARHHRKS